ncbi:hypothetical protein [Streptomyces anthocyanicus]|uniref:hypothetical protein n=1 Tax=Streptomyces anthocyanicus TaxID=68174 RepID=UPI003819B75A
MATRSPEKSFAALDVAGMNYGESRCALDQDLFPDRVIVGTETCPAGLVLTQSDRCLERGR